MRHQDIKQGDRVIIKVSGREQEAVVRYVRETVRVGFRSTRPGYVVALTYTHKGRSFNVTRKPAGVKPLSGSELAKKQAERSRARASRPKAPKRPAFETWHVMRPCSELVKAAREYYAAVLAFTNTAAKQKSFLVPSSEAERKAGFALFLRNNLRAHLLRRATYLEVQLGRTFPSDENLRVKLAGKAERAARSVIVAGGLLGRNQAASWAGYLATGQADGYGSRR